MSRINLYFGNSCKDWANETVNEIAINEEVSLERAKFIMLEKILKAISQRTNDQSYLDDSFGEFFERIVYAPKVSAKQYDQGGSRYPMIQISSSYVIHRLTGDYWPITEEVIKFIGSKIEEVFGIEFLDYKWAGHQKWLNLKQLELF